MVSSNFSGATNVVSLNVQPTHAVALTAGATVYPPFLLFIGGTGNVTVTTASGEAGVVFKNLPSGSTLPVLLTAVTAATATDLVLLC